VDTRRYLTDTCPIQAPIFMTAQTSAPATGPDTAQAIDQLLGADRAPAWWRRPAPWVVLVLVLGAVVGGWWWQSDAERNALPVYVTEPLKAGNLTLNVSANGTLQPIRAVTIGSELSGTVREVLVDVNDRVRRGQVLLTLDTAKLEDQVASSRAGLASARAQQALAEASLKEAESVLARQEEVARLSGGKVPSAAELDGARATADRARATLASARAAVLQAQATVSTNETNLSKASIRSPIDGVVLSRSVDPGNAVAASLQAVTLFTLAQDLRQLKLEVNVDEADVGVVQAGQVASFTVSAYPARRYPARVERVAFGSTKTDNVVTYTTTLTVDNSDLTLRPGMTATASVVAVERTGVLLVPNTALRFMPSNGEAAAPAKAGSPLTMMPRPPASPPKTVRMDRRAGARQIWVLRDGQPVAMPVTTGISDGRQTEVAGEGLVEGLAVITEQRSNGAAP
jgi:HlyD family secretion protein